LRDPYKNYNSMTKDELAKTYAHLNFSSILNDFGLSAANNVVIGQPDFFKAANEMVNKVSIDDWKVYLKFHLVNSYAKFLSSDFVNASFDFYGKALQGTKELKPRYKRMIAYTDDYMGEALGEIYVQKYFSEEAKKRAYEMVNNIATVFGNRIKNLDWMSAETKEKGLAKLGTFIKKLGYPDKWKDYSSLEISRNSFVENVIAAREFQFEDNVSKFGKPVDKMEWLMTPPTVNAYYNPVTNEISFPAGILQAPFFNASADDAVNYGGIGAVIGHEITHGFDDQGRQYDAEGNLKDWWTEEDGNKFKEKSSAVEKQYNDYVVLDSVHVNGQLTLGENIADLGGLSIAYEAYTMTEEYKKGEKINGFSPAQRFFISWAQVWRNNIRDEALAQRIITDPHSPGIYRANGPLTNMPEFYEAFGVKEGDKMWKPEAQRAKIW
jgi:putative endopeptidase